MEQLEQTLCTIYTILDSFKWRAYLGLSEDNCNLVSILSDINLIQNGKSNLVVRTTDIKNNKIANICIYYMYVYYIHIFVYFYA